MAFLFVIAGETVAEAFKTNEHGRRPEAATELCRGAAEILFSRLVELGSWVSLSVLSVLSYSPQVRHLKHVLSLHRHLPSSFDLFVN